MIKKISHPFRSMLDRIAQSSNSLMYGLVALLVLIGPLLFVPAYAFPVANGKGLLVFIIAVIAVLIAGVTVLKKGAVGVPQHILFWILGGLVLAQLLGAILSPSFSMAFLGYGFETTTWLFVLIFSLVVLFSYKTVGSYQRVGILYGSLLVPFVLLIILHAVRFAAGTSVLSLGVLGSATSTLAGAWSDLGIFLAVVLLFSTLTLQLAGLRGFAKGIVAISAVVSAGALAFMDIGVLWSILGLVSLLLILYLFAFAYWDTSAHTYKKENRVPWYVLLLFVVSVVCIFFGGVLNSIASRHQNIAWNDVRPSLSSTFKATGASLAHNPITGYGPNSFGLDWSLAKPASISNSTLADSGFSLGYSYFFTQIAMNGILTAILWVTFFILLAYFIIRRMSQGFESSIDRYFIVSLGTLIIFLSLVSWTYVPGAYALILLAISIGAFLRISKQGKQYSFSFIKDPRASFFGILGLTIVILGTLLAGYIGIRKLASFVDDTRGMVLLNKGNEDAATSSITLASELASHDIYHAQLAQIALSDTNKIVASATAATKSAVTQQAEQVLGVALGNAKLATELNPGDYQNWVLLGDVYEAAVSLGVTDAYSLAQAAYVQAEKRDPHDANIILSLANLALANSDTPTALAQIQDSINVAPTEAAYLLRAQIQIGQQDWTDAAVSLKQAISYNPSDAILYVYLAVVYEKSGDLNDADSLYALIRAQFKDADTVINQVRANLGATGTAPDQTASSSSATTATTAAKAPVAPKAKK